MPNADARVLLVPAHKSGSTMKNGEARLGPVRMGGLGSMCSRCRASEQSGKRQGEERMSLLCVRGSGTLWCRWYHQTRLIDF